jgi:hypothetical protein
MYRRCLFIAVLVGFTFTVTANGQDGPKGAVVLIIRHAEDGGPGHDLAPRGHERAEAYKNYFLNFSVDSKRLEPADGRTVREGSKIENRCPLWQQSVH